MVHLVEASWKVAEPLNLASRVCTQERSVVFLKPLHLKPRPSQFSFDVVSFDVDIDILHSIWTVLEWM